MFTTAYRYVNFGLKRDKKFREERYQPTKGFED
jgi:hypothetical protein